MGHNQGVRTKRYPEPVDADNRDLGPASAGQSGDTQGLSDGENDDSESVAELAEEGQYFEAGIVSGVEDSPPADVSEVRVRQVREDDVPLEYLENEEPFTK
jgi:hypothetical protein